MSIGKEGWRKGEGRLRATESLLGSGTSGTGLGTAGLGAGLAALSSRNAGGGRGGDRISKHP